MKKFTDAIRRAVKNKNWFAGLFLALCLPDVCGALEMPGKQVGIRYKQWFTDNLGETYLPMFTAADCYYFRCACLHQGLDSHEKIDHEKIHFIPPPPRNNTVHLNKFNNVLQMQIDIFCTDIANAVDDWYEEIAKNDSEIISRMTDLIEIHPLTSLKSFISFE